MDDAVVLGEGELAAAVERRGGVLLEAHRHRPLQEGFVSLHSDRGDVHIERLAAVRQPGAHGLEVLNALDALDAVLEDDLLVIVGEEVRPVRLAGGVVGLAPQLADPIGGQFLGHIAPDGKGLILGAVGVQ